MFVEFTTAHGQRILVDSKRISAVVDREQSAKLPFGNNAYAYTNIVMIGDETWAVREPIDTVMKVLNDAAASP